MAEIKPTATTAAPRTTTTSVQPKRTKHRFMDRSIFMHYFRVLYLAFRDWQ